MGKAAELEAGFECELSAISDIAVTHRCWW